MGTPAAMLAAPSLLVGGKGGIVLGSFFSWSWLKEGVRKERESEREAGGVLTILQDRRLFEFKRSAGTIEASFVLLVVE